MELSLIVIVVVFTIIIFIFHKPLKRTAKSAEKMADYLNDTATTLSLEAKEENTRRVIEAMRKLEELGGPVDFDALYEQACGKNKTTKK